MALKQDGFDTQRAIFLAAVCGQAYTQFEQNGVFIVPTGYDVVTALDGKSLSGSRERFGFILESAGDVIVALRGTSTIDDWFTDATASQVAYKWLKNGGLAHRGFSRLYESLRDQIHGGLGKVSADKRLTVTGHSLGGALAALCAPDIAVNGRFAAPSVYTYGAPRAGDYAFAKAYAGCVADSYRIHNANDAVPHLPPFLFKIPRKDAIYFYAHTKFGVPLDYQNGSLVANHVISGYYSALAKRDADYAKRLSAQNPGLCP